MHKYTSRTVCCYGWTSGISKGLEPASVSGFRVICAYDWIIRFIILFLLKEFTVARSSSRELHDGVYMDLTMALAGLQLNLGCHNKTVEMRSDNVLTGLTATWTKIGTKAKIICQSAWHYSHMISDVLVLRDKLIHTVIQLSTCYNNRKIKNRSELAHNNSGWWLLY